MDTVQALLDQPAGLNATGPAAAAAAAGDGDAAVAAQGARKRQPSASSPGSRVIAALDGQMLHVQVTAIQT